MLSATSFGWLPQPNMPEPTSRFTGMGGFCLAAGGFTAPAGQDRHALMSLAAARAAFTGWNLSVASHSALPTVPLVSSGLETERGVVSGSAAGAGISVRNGYSVSGIRYSADDAGEFNNCKGRSRSRERLRVT